MEGTGQYFDGRTAQSRDVHLRLAGKELKVEGVEGGTRSWPLSGLFAVERPHPARPLRLKYDGDPGARLVIPPSHLSDALLTEARHLRPGVKGHAVRRFLLNFIIGIAIIAGLGYLLLQYAPGQVARMLPQEWRDRLGDRIERSFVKNAQQCIGKDGADALKAMADRLTSADSSIPNATVRVFDMPVVNAFALPGERLVLTSKLIETADSPEEVAGVLAHEMGHAYHRHPETGLVRVVGLQVLISVATGGSGGDTISNLAGVLTILSYSRDAERQADAFAQHTLEQAGIDPLGLSNFFKKVVKLKKEEPSSGFDDLLSMFNTHPGTQERIDSIKPLPGSIAARPALTAEEWAKLKKICDQKSQPSG